VKVGVPRSIADVVVAGGTFPVRVVLCLVDEVSPVCGNCCSYSVHIIDNCGTSLTFSGYSRNCSFLLSRRNPRHCSFSLQYKEFFQWQSLFPL
jgi:hypothetical protein